jgi:ubiquinol-cytochrome c reductase cytochrome b subunit
MWTRVSAWLDSRTGYRGLLRHLLDEPLPPGTGWAFTSGSVVSLLLGVQVVTGVVLAMYYVPAPALAWDSVQFIMQALPMGWLVRGLHFWGASFIVVATLVHLGRVFVLGSYKAPREVTWLTGLVSLLVILGFSLSGYLLPWDQKAYWATTVTVNVARSAPMVGEALATVLRGGEYLGALTLGRWYATHVFILPLLLVLFVVAHLALMRRHGISGPITPRPGSAVAFFPWHVLKDTVMMAAAFSALVVVALLVRAPLDPVANPADASYVPRPEWYFLWLFQLLKYFPGPLEPVGTQLVPGALVAFLVLLPFLDTRPDRHPWSPPRRRYTVAMVGVAGILAGLTALGFNDAPAAEEGRPWGLVPIGGQALTLGEGNTCSRCHVEGGAASSLDRVRVRRDDEWLLHHVVDPVAIAPGVRTETDPAPRSTLGRYGPQAVVAYLRRAPSSAAAPVVSPDVTLAATTFVSACATCHRLDGDGGQVGPDLSRVGSRYDRATLAALLADGRGRMPGFGSRLRPDQLRVLADYFSARQ